MGALLETEKTRRDFLKFVGREIPALYIAFKLKMTPWPVGREETPRAEITPNTSPIEVYLDESIPLFPESESDQFYGTLFAVGERLFATAQAYHRESVGGSSVNYRDVLVAAGLENNRPRTSDTLEEEGVNFRFPFTATNGEQASTVVVGPDGLEYRWLDSEGRFEQPFLIPPVIQGAEVVKAAHALSDQGEAVVAAEEFYYVIENNNLRMRHLVTAQKINPNDQNLTEKASSLVDPGLKQPIAELKRRDSRIVDVWESNYNLSQLLSGIGLNKSQINQLLSNKDSLNRLSIDYLDPQQRNAQSYQPYDKAEGYYLVLNNEDGFEQGRIKIEDGVHPRVVWSPKSQGEAFFIFAATPEDNIVAYKYGGDYDHGIPLTGYQDKFPFDVIRLANGMLVAVWRTQRRLQSPKIECRPLSPDGAPIGKQIELAKARYLDYSLSIPHATPLGDNGLVCAYTQGPDVQERYLYLNYLEFAADGAELAANRPVQMMTQGRRVLVPAVSPEIIALLETGYSHGDVGEQPGKGEAAASTRWLGVITRNPRTPNKPLPQQYRWQVLWVPRTEFANPYA